VTITVERRTDEIIFAVGETFRASTRRSCGTASASPAFDIASALSVASS